MIYYESHNFGDEQRYVFNEYDNFDYEILHFHRNYEFVCVLKGWLKVVVDSETVFLQEDQFILVHPNQIHAFFSDRKTHAKVAIFSPNIISSYYQNTLNKLPEKIVTQFNPQTGAYIRESLKRDMSLYELKSVLYAVCSEIIRQTKFIPTAEKQDFTTTHKILHYLETNALKTVTLKQMAKSLGYDYQYLSRYFNKHFNMPFPQMLNSYRTEHAAYLLTNSDNKIIDVALECGYTNLRSFNRNFMKIYNISPHQFRQKQKKLPSAGATG